MALMGLCEEGAFAHISQQDTNIALPFTHLVARQPENVFIRHAGAHPPSDMSTFFSFVPHANATIVCSAVICSFVNLCYGLQYALSSQRLA